MRVASYFNYLHVNCRKLHTLALTVERKVFKSDCLPCTMPKLTKRTSHVLILECYGRLGSCRVAFCTIAFGMGVDIPDIHCVIHYGPAADIDNCFHESGRAGRDGASSLSVLYTYPVSFVCRVSAAMKQYSRNHECK